MEETFLNMDYFNSDESYELEYNDEPVTDWPDSPETEPTPFDEEPWLGADPVSITLSDTPVKDEESDSNNDWESSGSSSGDKDESEDIEEKNKYYRGSAISFTGYGRCDCGCGSFGGHGNICTYCGHPYSAHSRYKK